VARPLAGKSLRALRAYRMRRLNQLRKRLESGAEPSERLSSRYKLQLSKLYRNIKDAK
jgi:hypothetical protein